MSFAYSRISNFAIANNKHNRDEVTLFAMADEFVGPPILPNIFLLQNSQRHNDSCFCIQCRQRRADAIVGPQRTKDELRLNFVRNLPADREERSNAVFEKTLKQIIHGAVYKDMLIKHHI